MKRIGIVLSSQNLHSLPLLSFFRVFAFQLQMALWSRAQSLPDTGSLNMWEPVLCVREGPDLKNARPSVTGMTALKLEMKSFKRAKKLNSRPQLNSGKCTLNNFGTHLVYLPSFGGRRLLRLLRFPPPASYSGLFSARFLIIRSRNGAKYSGYFVVRRKSALRDRIKRNSSLPTKIWVYRVIQL